MLKDLIWYLWERFSCLTFVYLCKKFVTCLDEYRQRCFCWSNDKASMSFSSLSLLQCSWWWRHFSFYLKYKINVKLLLSDLLCKLWDSCRGHCVDRWCQKIQTLHPDEVSSWFLKVRRIRPVCLVQNCTLNYKWLRITRILKDGLTITVLKVLSNSSGLQVNSSVHLHLNV